MPPAASIRLATVTLLRPFVHTSSTTVRSLSSGIESLLERLGADPAVVGEEGLARVLDHPDSTALWSAIKALSKLDPKGLSSAEKRDLRERVQKILARDQALVMALFALKEDVAARISHRRIAVLAEGGSLPEPQEFIHRVERLLLEGLPEGSGQTRIVIA